jgi:hypothetical protein
LNHVLKYKELEAENEKIKKEFEESPEIISEKCHKIKVIGSFRCFKLIGIY